MSGDYTTTAEQPEPAPAKDPAAGRGTTRFEFHVNNGEAHLHDRTNQRKVAVPVAEWFRAMRATFGTLSGSSNQWKYADVPNQTLLSVHTQVDGERLRTEIQITPLVPDHMTQQLLEFFNESLKSK